VARLEVLDAVVEVRRVVLDSTRLDGKRSVLLSQAVDTLVDGASTSLGERHGPQYGKGQQTERFDSRRGVGEA
jgi:hypothetical protein